MVIMRFSTSRAMLSIAAVILAATTVTVSSREVAGAVHLDSTTLPKLRASHDMLVCFDKVRGVCVHHHQPTTDDSDPTPCLPPLARTVHSVRRYVHDVDALAAGCCSL